MKKLKLKKKVKVITTLLSFGMLLTVLPSMKLVAEDDTVTADTSDVSVGPYIKYQPSEDTYYSDEAYDDYAFTTLEDNDQSRAVSTDGSTANPAVNEDGSYTYNGSVTVDKTITKETKKNADNEDEDVYKLDMRASSISKIVNYNSGVDYILMIDTSNYITETRLNGLKDALYSFVDNVYKRAPGSRIALIKYNTEATVLTNNADEVDIDETKRKVDQSALVTVSTHKDDLLALIGTKVNDSTGGYHYEGGLTANTSLGSYSDLAMFEALKIFQKANNDTHKDDLGQKYCDRTRVSILFTAGIPGDGEEDDNSKNDLTGWSKSARNSAQATMSMATIMKGDRGDTIPVVDNSNVASGDSWGILKENYQGLSYVGCYSTVYTIGINLPNFDIPSTITESTSNTITDSTSNSDKLFAIADINETEKITGWRKTYGFDIGLKPSKRKAALINEFMYRVSSIRFTGEHFSKDNENLEQSFKDLYSKIENKEVTFNFSTDHQNTNISYPVKNLFTGDKLYYFYTDYLTRDIEGGYYFTATDDSIELLTQYFTQIAQQVGSTYEGLSVRDYIDSSFVPVSVDENGVIHELKVDETVGITADGKYVGTLKKDNETGLFYIEWSDVKLSPKSSETANDAKTFNESIYVKPIDGLIGGKNLYTNSSNSGIYIGNENKFPFPQPTVDIPINYTLSKEDQNIYLTNTVNILDMIKNLPNGANNKGVTMVYTVIDNNSGNEVGRYTILPGESTGTWNDGFDGMVTPDNDQNYTITCTITTSIEDTDHSVTDAHHVHADVDYSTNKGASANINVFKPVLTYQDLTVYYGDAKPNNPDALKSVSWQHGSDIALRQDGSNSKYTEPSLTLVYTEPDEIKNSNIVPIKDDYQVSVTVKVGNRDITNLSTFNHLNCSDKSEEGSKFTPDSNFFIVHVKTCSLKIVKEGGKSGETYVFTVKKDGNVYTKASITVGTDDNQVVINELPAGKYTVIEDSDLSWRYTSSYDKENAELSRNKHSDTITCTNTISNDKWLNKISSVAKNVFGISHTTTDNAETNS